MIALSLHQKEWFKQYGLGLLLIPFALYFATGVEGYNATGILGMLVHSLNLLPHEAGHFFFRFFGEFMMILGGSLLQIILPAIFVWSAIKFGNKVGAQISLLWLGQNFIDVGVYAADAQDRALPLLGGLGPESHDWYNILSMTGTLEQTPLISGIIFALAIPCWILMVVIPKWVW